jgi:hypothetical protein
LYKEVLLENKEIIKKILSVILEKVKFHKTHSGYYLTTDQIVSEKLKNQYGIQYIRVYSHIPTKYSMMYIKFIDDDFLKINFNSKLLEEKLNNGKTKRKRRKKTKSNN